MKNIYVNPADYYEPEDESPLEQAVAMFKYFWREKGDPERWCDFDEKISLLKEHRPELIKAWRDYKAARRLLNRLTE